MRVVQREYDNGPVQFRHVYMDGRQTDDELKQRLEAFRELYVSLQREQRRTVLLFELGESFDYSARQRSIQADWGRDVAELEREVLIANAFVTPSLVIRGMITAVYWLWPPAAAYTVQATLLEALTWSFDLCEQHGISMPDSVRRDCRARLLGAPAVRPAISGRG